MPALRFLWALVLASAASSFAQVNPAPAPVSPARSPAVITATGAQEELVQLAYVQQVGLVVLGGFAAAGTSPRPWDKLAQGMAALAGELAGVGFRGPFAVADGRIIHNAGGSEAQELAFAIASALAESVGVGQDVGVIAAEGAGRLQCV